jgi:DNA topoisomerase-3
MRKKITKLGACPRCGEPVVERQGFYGCEGWRNGCDFTVSVHALASIGHPVISSTQMRKLLRGPTRMVFKTANGVERLFMVELREMEGRWRPWIDFEAGSETEILGRCPLCGADVAESPLSYGCSRWEEGCEFAIFKNSIKRFGGKMLSKQKAKELLKAGFTTVTIRGFDGSPREVTLRLDREFGCKIDFEGEER